MQESSVDWIFSLESIEATKHTKYVVNIQGP